VAPDHVLEQEAETAAMSLTARGTQACALNQSNFPQGNYSKRQSNRANLGNKNFTTCWNRYRNYGIAL
jgi:hypothetical protein